MTFNSVLTFLKDKPLHRGLRTTAGKTGSWRLMPDKKTTKPSLRTIPRLRATSKSGSRGATRALRLAPFRPRAAICPRRQIATALTAIDVVRLRSHNALSTAGGDIVAGSSPPPPAAPTSSRLPGPFHPSPGSLSVDLSAAGSLGAGPDGIGWWGRRWGSRWGGKTTYES